jgi:hypothetical protein
MKLRRVWFAIRTVRSDSGGIIENRPFCVKLGFLKLIYREGEQKLTLPVEPLLGPDQRQIGVGVIRHWDGSSEPFQEYDRSKITYNIYAALDRMHEKYLR